MIRELSDDQGVAMICEGPRIEVPRRWLRATVDEYPKTRLRGGSPFGAGDRTWRFPAPELWILDQCLIENPKHILKLSIFDQALIENRK